MTPLRWTRTPPTEAGMFWIGCTEVGCEMCPHIVQVFFKVDGTRMVAWDGDAMDPTDKNFPIKYDAIRWAGPIAPPEEDPA